MFSLFYYTFSTAGIKGIVNILCIRKNEICDTTVRI